jgi:hypothetical protein
MKNTQKGEVLLNTSVTSLIHAATIASLDNTDRKWIDVEY